MFIDYYLPMHVPFKIHYRNNLIDKKDSYLNPRPPSWDDRNNSFTPVHIFSFVLKQYTFYTRMFIHDNKVMLAIEFHFDITSLTACVIF